ncbi:MAG: type II toxin-antitoxin system VapC family toxin [Myxococcota bacterium]
MKALDTNVLVRFLLNDDEAQGRRVKELFERAEATAGRFLITTPAVLETIWVLSAVYDFTRDETVDAIELLAQMPILEFDDYDQIRELIRLARSTAADLPDLVIGLAGEAHGCEATLTFEKGLQQTGLFEPL